MNWIISSLLMYFSSVYYYVGLRYFQKRNVNNLILNFISFVIYGVSFLSYAVITNQDLTFPPELLALTAIVIFFTSYLGNTMSLNGTKYAPNAGYSLIIQKSYAIFTSIVSIWLFNSELSMKNAISIIVIIFFMFVMNYKFKKDAEKTTEHKKIEYKWLLYSFGAFFAFGGLTLYTKWLVSIASISVMTRTIYGAVIVSGFFLVELLVRMGTKKIKFDVKISPKQWVFLVSLGIMLGAFNYFMVDAIMTAPNLGYVNIINGASITMITLMSAWVYKEELSRQKIFGILGVTAGLVMLFI